jgi:HK97 gp10 family phage protein
MISIIRNTIPKGLKLTAERIDGMETLAIEAGIKILRSNVSKLTPIDTHRSKSSIEGQPFEKGDSIESIESTRKGKVGYLGTDVEYWKFFEFGTSKQKAQLPFTKGLDKSQDEWPKEYNKIFKDGISRIKNN